MAQSQTKDTGRAATHGQFAKYLEAENPNCPADKLSERFREAKALAEKGDKKIKHVTKWRLERIRTNWSCPNCGSSDVFYTRKIRITQCDDCGLNIYETDEKRGE